MRYFLSSFSNQDVLFLVLFASKGVSALFLKKLNGFNFVLYRVRFKIKAHWKRCENYGFPLHANYLY